jgi:hypothetical protein
MPLNLHVHIHHYRKELGHGSAGEKAAIASPKRRYYRLSRFSGRMLAAISIYHLNLPFGSWQN